jgi:cobalt-zinc-cadmium efflux system protein
MPEDAHDHHDHHHHRGSSQTRLAATMVLVAVYMVAEFVGGWLTNSLALMADAGHMLSDAAALGLSLFAVWIARRPATARHTYGFYRAEILAALANGATLIGVSLYIFFEAYHRFYQPPEVLGAALSGIAFGGLLVNLISLWILGGHGGENLNVRGAWLHVLTDLLGSVGAIIAGLLVWFFGWRWADPLTSVAIGLLVIYSSWRLLAEAVSVLMEGAPAGIDVDQVLGAIREQPGVAAVHDLHVWSITSGVPALSVHVVITQSDYGAMLTALRKMLHDRFGVHHSTIQLEPENFEERCQEAGCN